MNVYLQRYLGLEEGREYARPAGFPTLKDLEKDYIGFLLEITDHNRAEVSRILAISRSTLYHKMRRYALAGEISDGLPI
jgi:DNA-binding NtrC family response regulator